MSKIKHTADHRSDYSKFILEQLPKTLKGAAALSVFVAPATIILNRLNGRVHLLDVTIQTFSITLLWISMSTQFPEPISRYCRNLNEKVVTTLDTAFRKILFTNSSMH